MRTAETLAPENQFILVCPVFSVDVKIAGCFMLRDLVWKGEKVETRKGCQCAMHAGKCPIPAILTRMIRDGSDDYASREPRKGALRAVDMDRIERVIVPEKAIDGSQCSPGEARLLRAANDAARLGKRVKAGPVSRGAIKRPVEETPPGASETIEAATTGNMSAALNAEVASKAVE